MMQTHSVGRWLMFILILRATCSAVSQQQVHLQITTTDNVHFLMTDPQGRTCGRDPRGASNPSEGTEIDGIPVANYSFETVAAIPDSGESSFAVYYHVLACTYDSPQCDGTYRIQIIGIGLGRFDLYASVDPAKGSNCQRARFKVKGAMIDTDSTITYVLSYSSSPSTRSSFEKEVSVQTVRQDLSVSFKLALLGDAKWLAELFKDLSKTEKQISSHNEPKARQELEKFQDKIEDARKKTIKKEEQKKKHDKVFITADAYKTVQEDVAALRRHLSATKGKKGKR
jgi:hypothetical protein